MDIKFTKEERNLIIKINGEIDHHTAEEVRTKVDNEYSRSNSKNIIFDFSGITFMDSSGIGMVIGRYKATEKQGGKVVVCSISGDAKRIFNISGLQKIINSYDSLEMAVLSLQ